MVVTLAGCPSIPRPRTFGDGAGEGRGYFVGAIPFFQRRGGEGRGEGRVTFKVVRHHYWPNERCTSHYFH